MSNALSVNLLPAEIILQRQHKSKLILFGRISIVFLILVILTTSVLIAFRVIQAAELSKSNKDLVFAQTKVNSLADKEKQWLIFNKRLSSINNVLGSDMKRKAIFNLVIYLIPETVKISEATLDRSGAMSLSLNSVSLSSVESFFTDLGNKEKNSDMIAKVELSNFSLGKDGIYYFALRIIPKQN